MGGDYSQENHRWEKKHGSYYWMHGTDIRCMTDSVAVAFSMLDEDTTVMHKMGKPDSVKRWVEETQQKYRDAGLEEDAKQLIVLESDKWDVEDLNKILHITGYIAAFLKKSDIALEGYIP
jgi:hypothetical protein